MHPCGVVQEQMPPWPGLLRFTLLSPFAHVPYFAVQAFTQPPAINGVVLHDGAADEAAGGVSTVLVAQTGEDPLYRTRLPSFCIVRAVDALSWVDELHVGWFALLYVTKLKSFWKTAEYGAVAPLSSVLVAHVAAPLTVL